MNEFEAHENSYDHQHKKVPPPDPILSVGANTDSAFKK